MKRAKPSSSFVQSATVKTGGVPTENCSNKQVDTERVINHHQNGNREHNEKQQAEAAVHQHFEESLKLAQQQRVSSFS